MEGTSLLRQRRHTKASVSERMPPPPDQRSPFTIGLLIANIGVMTTIVVLAAFTYPDMYGKESRNAWEQHGSSLYTKRRVSVGAAGGGASLNLHSTDGAVPHLSMHSRRGAFAMGISDSNLTFMSSPDGRQSWKRVAWLGSTGYLAIGEGAPRAPMGPGLGISPDGAIQFSAPGSDTPIATIRVDSLGQLVVQVSGHTAGPALTVSQSGRVGINLPHNTAPTATLDVNGNVQARSYMQTSDAGLKTNIERIDACRAKECLDSIHGYTYTMADNEPHAGLMAQEVVQCMPEAVRGDPGGYAVDYSAVTAYIVAAMQCRAEE